MAATITGMTPAKGSPFGGQVVTITGSGFGASGTVTVEGRTATIGTWSATSVTATIPQRNDGNGIVWTGTASVAVVLTAQDASTATTTYTYNQTQVERAVDYMASRLGACTVQNGYNFTITPAQVRAMRVDGSIPTGSAWPQLIAYIGDGVETLTDEPFDFAKDTIPVIVEAVMPCDNFDSWRNQGLALISDIRRAVMRERSNGGTCNTTTVLGADMGKAQDQAAGSLAWVGVTFSIEVQSIINNMTTNTEFDANLP